MQNAGRSVSSFMKIPIYGLRMRKVMLSALSAAVSNGKINCNAGRIGKLGTYYVVDYLTGLHANRQINNAPLIPYGSFIIVGPSPCGWPGFAIQNHEIEPGYSSPPFNSTKALRLFP